VIHKIDPSHPVSTAHGELPDVNALSLCPNVDVWGMNVYRWDNPEGIFNAWSAISSKPMYLSEAGADSYMTAKMKGYEQGENEKAQADAIRNVFIGSSLISGLFFMPIYLPGTTTSNFVANAEQTGSAITGIKLLVFVIPGILYMSCAVFMLFYKIDTKPPN
jgi:hypothetical protein